MLIGSDKSGEIGLLLITAAQNILYEAQRDKRSEW